MRLLRFLIGVMAILTVISAGWAADAAESQPTTSPGGPASQAKEIFFAENGMLVIEVESAPPVGDWKEETDLKGYAGKSYYTWRGDNLHNQPGSGVLAYPFRIFMSGKYQLRLHNRHDFEDSTEQNDVWTRVDDGPWIKLYSSWNGRWVWHSHHELDHSTKPAASYDLQAGDHTFYLSGRSQGFSIDRIVLFTENTAEKAMDLNTPPSPSIPVMPDLDQLPDVEVLWHLGRLGMALKSAQEKTASSEPPVALQAKMAERILLDYLAYKKVQLTRLKETDAPAAMAGMNQLAMQFIPIPIAGEIVSESNQIRQEPRTQQAILAQKQLDEIRAIINEGPTNEQAKNDPEMMRLREQMIHLVSERLQQLCTEFPNTPAAYRAHALAQPLGITLPTAQQVEQLQTEEQESEEWKLGPRPQEGPLPGMISPADK